MLDPASIRPTRAMVRRAAQWAAEIDGGITQERALACEAWCDVDARHRLALDRMCGINARFDDLDTVEQHALSRSARRRGGAASSVMLGGGALAMALVAWLGVNSLALRQYWPDQRTGTGVIRAMVLNDGSVLDLDTDTSLDTSTSASQRRVGLFRGQVMAHVASDHARPFVVETREGTATALGTVFSVRRDDTGTVVTVIESHVRVCAARFAGAAQCAELHAGQRARLVGGTVALLAPVSPEQAAAWTKGWLEADDMPVSELLAELNRYRSDPVRFDASSLADLRITGSFPLTDPDRALSALIVASGLTITQDTGKTRISAGR